MAKVTVLFLKDKLVGPHMELLRNICDPSSLSKPHVTVRYSDELVAPPADFDLPIRYIDLVEARAFGLNNHESRARFTVYVKAASDQLEFLHYKQGYPDSEFHITAYNGSTRRFAEHLLVILRKFDWHLRVQLPRGTRLVEIPVRPERLKKANTPREFDPAVQRLFKKITSLEMTWPLVRDMTDNIRLELAEQICSHLISRAGDIRNPVAQDDADSHSVSVVSGLRENGPKPEIYLTPPELARDISRLALKYHKRKVPIKFGDPAVGTGAFYAALLETAGKQLVESAIGIDINHDNLLVARKKWGRRGLEVKHADFLHLEELSPRSLILANPPYLRQQRIDPAYKWKLRERASVKTQTVVSGLSGLYVYFMLLCDAWMDKGCVAAWLIPSEFMQTDYGSAIRKYLTEKVELLRIHKFDVRPRFEAVQVFPSVVVFRKGPPKKSSRVSVTEGGSLLSPENCQSISVEELRSQEKWRFTTNEKPVNSTTDLRIGDLFEIRRGIATGANDFFVLSSEQVKTLGIPGETLKPLLPKAHLIKSDIVESNGNGLPAVFPQLFLLDVDLDELEITQKYPELKAYLDTAEKKGVRNRTLVRSRKSWYKQEVREPAPYLCTYMGREKASGPPLRFIWNMSNAVVTNTYLMLYPKLGLQKAIEKDLSKAKEVFELLKDSAEQTMHEKWRLHAGGLRKIEPRELADVRLLREPKWLTEAMGLNIR